MNDLTLNPGVAALPSGDKQIVVPTLSATGVRRRVELRSRRRLNVRALQTGDGGFRPFRIF